MIALRISAAGFLAGFALVSSATAAPTPVQVLPQVQSDIVQAQFKTVCRKVAVGNCDPRADTRCKTERVCSTVPDQKAMQQEIADQAKIKALQKPAVQYQKCTMVAGKLDCR